ncbi:UNVERIFIED_ORG: hypothetical protein GGE63_003307 [Rhizobium esperanzae]
MDSRIGRVLDIYHEMIETDRNSPRDMPPSGRDGGQDSGCARSAARPGNSSTSSPAA